MKKGVDLLTNAIRGFCMALADSVPGVSGSTIAFIMGFYDKFISSLNDIIFGDKKEKKDALRFLLKLGIGWVVGMAIATFVLTNLFEQHIYGVSSLFLGLIIFSIPLIVKEEKNSIKNKYKNIWCLILGVAIVVLITILKPVDGGSDIDISDLNIGMIFYIFIAAMVAISAMVLPGISGSTILLILGLYMPIMNALKEFMKLNLQYFPVLLIFGLGVITGILVIIKSIKKALEKYRSQTIYLIIGLMIGSIFSIIMGPTTLEIPKDPLGFSTFNVFMFIIGGLIIYGLEKYKDILESRGIEDEAIELEESLNEAAGKEDQEESRNATNEEAEAKTKTKTKTTVDKKTASTKKSAPKKTSSKKASKR